MRMFRWLRAGLDTGSVVHLVSPNIRLGISPARGGNRSRTHVSVDDQASVSIHAAATDPCVARGNGVGKISAAAWMDTPEVPRNSGLLPAFGRHTARDATEPPVGDSLGGSRYQARPALIFAALALTACAHQPLTRSCLTAAQYEQMKAAEPAKVHDKLTGQADADIRPITGSAIELRSWGEAELGLLSICASNPNTP